MGATAVVDDKGDIAGIITDGDLRRILQANDSIEGLTASQIMSANPKTIEQDEAAINAFNLMEKE